ncbi:Serine hydrolase (FSH1) [Microdochium nivale]|nr:Serine hydrolase (FSH1) [Microdochium nivale]
MAQDTTTTTAADRALALPRILCLHGGGTNASIFRAQCRAVSRALSPRHFRLVYAEAPFASQPGPDVLSVYADCGPFKRWLRWKPEHPAISDADTVRAIDDALRSAMDADDEDEGGTGPWVGLLGFSQGAKIAASLLMRQQILLASAGGGSELPSISPASWRNDKEPVVEWKFAILLAGRAPLVNLLSEHVFSSPMLSRPSQIGLGDDGDDSSSGALDLRDLATGKHMLALPTVHVHGLLDEGLALHRELRDVYCEPGTAALVEWVGMHRVPIKSADVQAVVDAVVDVAAATGAII